MEKKFDLDKKFIIEAPEFIRINNDKFLTDIGIINGDLVFHFFEVGSGWAKWDQEKIDKLFEEVFNSPVKDFTGLFEKRVRELKTVSKALSEMKNDTAKIQKAFLEGVPFVEKSTAKFVKSWSYTIKSISDPFVDIKAERIVKGIKAILG